MNKNTIMATTKYGLLLIWSDDGVNPTVFTNMKALYTFICETADRDCYVPAYIDSLSRAIRHDQPPKKIKFSYSSMIKEIRNNQSENRATMLCVECEGGSSFEVIEVDFRSK